MGSHRIFSVLRLCGSRQVVAHCCADERIIQMHIQCPSLGSLKWSADHYAVRSHVRPKRQETQKQSKTTKTKPAKPSERSTDKDSSNRAGNLCANELRYLAQNKNKQHQTTVQDLAKVSSKTNHSAAPKPRIPPARIPEIALRSPPGMRHLRNYMQPCNELESNTSVGTLPCKAPKHP